ncbi:MAG: glutamine--fructose-6-phosphate transaminase (isomerizing) [Deltaproteobacteria bacterium]|nr:glutamine--fructose-6-phosphate transaminase (isomerizing) [Deltaproteobacteria bacterium]
MCGIVGVVGKTEIAPILVESLCRLEYRGYDSCGVATLNSVGVEVRKDVGFVQEVAYRQKFASAHGGLGIAHTRWATHGGVTRENAHPHLSCDGTFAVAHNGIISNHEILRRELRGLGHRFSSETDTEVFPHIVEEIHRSGISVEEAFVRALRRLEGSFAIAMISSRDPEKIYCARQRSPLVLGIDSGRHFFVGSDVNAFLHFTRRAVVLEDGEYAVLSRDGYFVRAIADGRTRSKPIMEINWSLGETEKAGYRHYMEKEIWEQPDVIRRAMEVSQKEIVAVARLMRAAKRNVLVGVGTTYYVSLFGQYLFAGLAGEFSPAFSSDESGELLMMDRETLLLAISQSGETFDTLQTIRQAKADGARTAAIVNVPGSSMTREAEIVIHQNSGPEICVISTKAAMAQMLLLMRMALELGYLRQHPPAMENLDLLREIMELPDLVETMLRNQQLQIRDLAHRFSNRRNWFYLGRGLYTPIALESALKMKEVTYLHAEGMAAGFLKHGTLSLIDEETPCVFLIPPKEAKDLYDLTMGSVAEVRARRGKVIAFAFESGGGKFDEEVILPKASVWLAPLLHLVAGQVLAYETALVLGRNIDRPRSLAKSVTVS